METDVISRRSRNSFRPDIEGLRALAVLLVVGCHCGISWCAGGFVGVDVFFVLSGYLITGLLTVEFRETSRIDLFRFYARRARRLVPACALVVAATTLFAAILLEPPQMTFAARAARSASVYLSNVFFDRSAANYFEPDVEGNPLLHTWSLGVEEQFYLLWPLLIIVADRGARWARRPLWILSGLTAFSFICCLYTTRLAPTVAFYELPARAWEFAAGGLLALLPIAKTSAGTRWAIASGIVGIVMILGTAVLVKGGAGFPGWIALFPVVGTVAALFAGAKSPQRGISVLLSGPALQYIGARSYAWYLWHWPFVVFASTLFPGITVGGKIVAAVASMLPAALTFSFLESRVRGNIYLAARPGLSLRLAAGAMLLTVGAAWMLMLFARHLTMDSAFRSVGAAEADYPAISIHSCVGQGFSPDVKICVFGASSAPRSVVLFGDSHALQWFNPFLTAANMETWRLVTVLKVGCAASDINPHHLSANADPCREWRTRAIEKIVAIQPTAVVMASYTGAIIRGFHAEAPISPEELRLGTRRTLERLLRVGVPIVILRDTPLPPYDIPACVARRVSQQLPVAATCDFDASTALDGAAFSAERASADGLPNVSFLDLNDLICPGSSCPAMRHGLIIYRDDNHLASTFAETLAPALRTRLFEALRNTQ
jgi:peptidoglycan/LPS O-acetylase OafA/YrhL